MEAAAAFVADDGGGAAGGASAAAAPSITAPMATQLLQIIRLYIDLLQPGNRGAPSDAEAMTNAVNAGHALGRALWDSPFVVIVTPGQRAKNVYILVQYRPTIPSGSPAKSAAAVVKTQTNNTILVILIKCRDNRTTVEIVDFFHTYAAAHPDGGDKKKIVKELTIPLEDNTRRPIVLTIDEDEWHTKITSGDGSVTSITSARLQSAVKRFNRVLRERGLHVHRLWPDVLLGHALGFIGDLNQDEISRKALDYLRHMADLFGIEFDYPLLERVANFGYYGIFNLNATDDTATPLHAVVWPAAFVDTTVM